MADHSHDSPAPKGGKSGKVDLPEWAVKALLVVGIVAALLIWGPSLLRRGPAVQNGILTETSVPLMSDNCPRVPSHVDLRFGDEPTVISDGDCFVKFGTKGRVRLFDADGAYIDVGPAGGSTPGFWTVSAQAIDKDVRFNYMLTAS